MGLAFKYVMHSTQCVPMFHIAQHMPLVTCSPQTNTKDLLEIETEFSLFFINAFYSSRYSDPTHSIVVIRVIFFQTELVVEICSKSLVRAIGNTGKRQAEQLLVLGGCTQKSETSGISAGPQAVCAPTQNKELFRLTFASISPPTSPAGRKSEVKTRFLPGTSSGQ